MTLWGSHAATLSQRPAAVTSAAATPTAASTASRPGLRTRTATIMPDQEAGASGVAAAQRECRGGSQDEDPCREPGHRAANKGNLFAQPVECKGGRIGAYVRLFRA